MALPLAAQDILPQDNEKYDAGIRLGAYLSLVGTVALAAGPWPGPGIIESPEDDVPAYPFLFYSIRYNKNYEVMLGWGDDANGHYVNSSNEKMLKLALRYNRYGTKHMYMFLGPVFWRFNKWRNHTTYVCHEYEDEYAEYSFPSATCKEGASREVEIKTDRPDGISIHFGALLGLGIEYKLLGFIVFSHELEFFFSPCGYKDFICRGGDIKLFGIHLEF